LTAALHIQPVSHLQTETLVAVVRFEHVQRELGTFLDKEEEAEKETDRLLVDKTKLNWKYSNKFLKQVSGIDLNLANLHCSRGVARCPPKKCKHRGGQWAMGNGQRFSLPIAHCPKMQTL